MPAAFGLHKSMFIKTLDAQGTDEQRELFLAPAKRFEIIGAPSPTGFGVFLELTFVSD
jgi:acyl-CoA oxidase